MIICFVKADLFPHSQRTAEFPLTLLHLLLITLFSSQMLQFSETCTLRTLTSLCLGKVHKWNPLGFWRHNVPSWVFLWVFLMPSNYQPFWLFLPVLSDTTAFNGSTRSVLSVKFESILFWKWWYLLLLFTTHASNLSAVNKCSCLRLLGAVEPLLLLQLQAKMKLS